MNNASLGVYIHINDDTDFDASWLTTGCVTLSIGDKVSIFLRNLDEADQLHAAILKAKRFIIENDRSQQGRGLTVFPTLRQETP